MPVMGRLGSQRGPWALRSFAQPLTGRGLPLHTGEGEFTQSLAAHCPPLGTALCSFITDSLRCS